MHICAVEPQVLTRLLTDWIWGAKQYGWVLGVVLFSIDHTVYIDLLSLTDICSASPSLVVLGGIVQCRLLHVINNIQCSNLYPKFNFSCTAAC